MSNIRHTAKVYFIYWTVILRFNEEDLKLNELFLTETRTVLILFKR